MNTSLTLNKDEWTVPDVGIEMLRVKAGSFLMGSSTKSSKRLPEEVEHSVTINKPFWLGKYPITQGQWQTVMGDNPSFFKLNQQLPVENVTWFDVNQFCNKLNESARQLKTIPKSYAYSLPTEAEWEYACKAETNQDVIENLDKIAWHESNSHGVPHPVGKLLANNWGFHDMLGNVWEWCYDWMQNYPSSAEKDLEGPDTGTFKVYRGGSWYYFASYCRPAFRFGYLPTLCNGNLGFRLCLAPLRKNVKQFPSVFKKVLKKSGFQQEPLGNQLQKALILHDNAKNAAFSFRHSSNNSMPPPYDPLQQGNEFTEACYKPSNILYFENPAIMGFHSPERDKAVEKFQALIDERNKTSDTIPNFKIYPGETSVNL